MSHRVTTLSKRVKLATGSLFLVGVLKYDKNNKPKEFIVPGSGGKQYRVILRRGDGIVSTECHLLVGNNEIVCKGNSNGSVCRHSIQAVEKAIELAKLKISFCQEEKDAKRLSHVIHGKVYGVKSFQSKGKVWGVVNYPQLKQGDLQFQEKEK